MSDVSKGANLPAVAGNTTAVGIVDPQQSDDTFIAEFANMDLEPLKDHTYMVAVSNGDRNKCKFLNTTVRGPYSFLEMVQEIGFMYEEHQHHGKAIVMEKDRMKPVRHLDFKTLEYIEAHYQTIIADTFLEEVLGKSATPFTHTANIIEGTVEEDVILNDAKIKADNKAAADAITNPKDEDEDI